MPTAIAPDGTGQDPETSDPPAGTEDASQDGASDGTSGITDVAVLQKELAKVRREAAENRVKLKAFEDVKAETDKATLTEQQRLERHSAELEKKLAEAEAKARIKVLEAAVAKASTKLGIIDPDAAVKLLDTSDLELDDEGEPKNIDAALKALLKERPWLAGKPEAGSGGLNGASGGEGGPPPKLTADELAAAQAAGMTPERYEKLKNIRTLDDWRQAQPPAK